MREATIKILHRIKDKTTCQLVHKEIYNGPCRVAERFSVREQLGGVENNSNIVVLISSVCDFPVECGDRCVIDGINRTVRKVSKCLGPASQGFRHICLSLR